MNETIWIGAPGWWSTLVLLVVAYCFGLAAGERRERTRARAAPLHLDAGLVAAELARGTGNGAARDEEPGRAGESG